MDKYSDPDILDAPLNLTSFELLNESNKVIPEIRPTDGFLKFTVRFAVHVPEQFINNSYPLKYRVFMTISAKTDEGERGIWQSIGELPLRPQNPRNPLIYRYDFSVNADISNIIKQIDSVNIQLSVSSKHNGEMGISESLRLGRFLYTNIPVVLGE